MNDAQANIAALDILIGRLDEEKQRLGQEQREAQMRIAGINAQREAAAAAQKAGGVGMHRDAWSALGAEKARLQHAVNDLSTELGRIKTARAAHARKRHTLLRSGFDPAFRAAAKKVLHPEVYQHIADMAAEDAKKA